MTILMTLVTMLAFAGVYSLIATMIGDHWSALVGALAGGAPQRRSARDQAVASRAVSRA